MCLTCGCMEPNDKHGNDAHLTEDEFMASAKASKLSPGEALDNLIRTLDLDRPSLSEAQIPTPVASQFIEELWYSEFQEKRGNPQALRDWFTEDPEGKIRWGTKDSFDRCVSLAGKYMDDEQAKGFCNLRHRDATGHYAGEKGWKK